MIGSEFWSHSEYLLVADRGSNFERRGSGNKISNCVAGSGDMITVHGVHQKEGFGDYFFPCDIDQNLVNEL